MADSFETLAHHLAVGADLEIKCPCGRRKVYGVSNFIAHSAKLLLAPMDQVSARVVCRGTLALPGCGARGTATQSRIDRYRSLAFVPPALGIDPSSWAVGDQAARVALIRLAVARLG